MTITVDIKPEVQADLARRAASHGREIESYTASLLEDAVRLPAASVEPNATEAKDIVELFAPLRGLNLDFGRNPSSGRPIAHGPGHLVS